MRLTVVSGGRGWHVADLLRAAGELGVPAEAVDFRALAADCTHLAQPLAEPSVTLVRTMPAGTLQQVVFRMDALHIQQERGGAVVNPPRAVEVCVDKFLATARLELAGVPTPATWAGQSADAAMDAYQQLGGDVVLKPLFGAEGRGMTRVSDPDLAWRAFRAVEQLGEILYVQRYVRHDGSDLRAFVLGDRLLAAMRRKAAPGQWRANVAQGGSARAVELEPAVAELALRAARAVGATVAGVDLVRDERRRWLVLEVNAVPGWRALAECARLDVAKCVVRYLADGGR